MKDLVRCSWVMVLLGLLAGCGGNPVTAAEERDAADKKRKEAESENADLRENNEYLKVMLENAFATTNYIWILAGSFQTYDQALETCADLGYSLPNATQFSEFKSEVYDLKENWQEADIDSFYIVGDEGEQKSLVLCHRTDDKPFLDELGEE